MSLNDQMMEPTVDSTQRNIDNHVFRTINSLFITQTRIENVKILLLLFTKATTCWNVFTEFSISILLTVYDVNVS